MEEARTDTIAKRRRRILAAARAVFAEKGGLSAGLRPIAAAAGVTTGAIYAVFASKEDIYAALLQESLVALSTKVAAAAGREADPARALRASAVAFFEHYQDNRFEFGLGLYLFERDGRLGLGPGLDAVLNAELGRSLAVFEACFTRLAPISAGVDLTPKARADALFAGLIGVCAMALAGRDRSIGADAYGLLDTLLALQVASLKNNTVIN